MKVLESKIFHTRSGLQLNLGAKNNSVVSWVKPVAYIQPNESGINPIKAVKPTTLFIFNKSKWFIGWYGSGRSYDVAKYCFEEESISTCIEVGGQVAKDFLSKTANAEVLRGQMTFDLYKTKHQVLSDFVQRKGKRLFFIPNEVEMNWDKSSELCKKAGGELDWSYDVKTCFKRTPKPFTEGGGSW